MTTRFEATRLIPGRGEVGHNGVVVIDDTIAYAGSAAGAPDTPDGHDFDGDLMIPKRSDDESTEESA